MSDFRVCLVSASHQSAIASELLDAIRFELDALGACTATATDHFPPPTEGLVYLVIPHEYLPHVLDLAHPDEAQLSRTIALCCDDPISKTFEGTIKFAARAGKVLHTSRPGTHELGNRGVEAQFVQVGHSGHWDRWERDQAAERPIDVLVHAEWTEHRARVLAESGQVLKDRRTAIHLWEPEVEQPRDAPSQLVGEARWTLYTRANAVLWLNPPHTETMPWSTVMGAIANGCVVVAEHAVDPEPLVPGEHFISTSAGSVPLILEAALNGAVDFARMRTRAYDYIRDEVPFSASIPVLLDQAEQLAGVPIPSRAISVSSPLPKEPKRPVPEFVRVIHERTELDIIRSALRNILADQRRLGRQLDRVVSQANAAPSEDRVTTYGPYESMTPKVSVILTVYNYEHYVRDAIKSVALSEYDSFELVAVDDASTDGSLAAITDEVEAHPWLAAKLISRAENSGLVTSRNVGFAHARGEYVFVLDADNTIYPRCLQRLADALDENQDAAFAYPIVEKFDVCGPFALLSWQHWDPARLPYGNYIDAMAMVRMSAFKKVGGYSLHPSLALGWEDFALWCDFAEQGMPGVSVPEILARYRTGPNSMVSVTNINPAPVWDYLSGKHEFFRV